MEAAWLELHEAAEVRPGQIEVRGLIPTDSPFFSGHFPGNPVVPGIALLGLVKAALAQALPRREVTGFRRVKFRRVLQRGGALEATVEVDSGEGARFEVTAEGELLCDGLVVLASAPGSTDAR